MRAGINLNPFNVVLRKIFATEGMLILLVASIFFDSYIRFNPNWMAPLIYGIYIFLLWFLAWFVLVDSPRSLSVAVIFILVGLFGLFIMLPYFYREVLFPSIPRPVYVYPWVYPWANPVDLIAPLTQYTAGMILLIGLARLLPEKFFRFFRSNLPLKSPW